jgi:hypothetical protein
MPTARGHQPDRRVSSWTEDLHFVGGAAFRAVIPPQLVAYVDFGTAGDGLAVFTGVDYPF